MMEDYLFQNPLFKCLDFADKEDIKRNQVSCCILIDQVLQAENTLVNYNRMI